MSSKIRKSTPKELFCNRNILQHSSFALLLIFFNQFSYSQGQSLGDKKSDVARTFLLLEKEINPFINVENELHRIDSIAETLNCEFENCTSIHDSIKILNENLFYKQRLFF